MEEGLDHEQEIQELWLVGSWTTDLEVWTEWETGQELRLGRKFECKTWEIQLFLTEAGVFLMRTSWRELKVVPSPFSFHKILETGQFLKDLFIQLVIWKAEIQRKKERERERGYFISYLSNCQWRTEPSYPIHVAHKCCSNPTTQAIMTASQGSSLKLWPDFELEYLDMKCCNFNQYFNH